jgi:hypothetical protein
MPQSRMVHKPINGRNKDATEQRGKSPKPSSHEECPSVEVFPEKIRILENGYRKTDVDNCGEKPDDEHPSNTYQWDKGIREEIEWNVHEFCGERGSTENMGGVLNGAIAPGMAELLSRTTEDRRRVGHRWDAAPLSFTEYFALPTSG